MAVTPTTWNPADKDATVSLSGGDLTASSTTGSVRSVFGATSGKYYWEVTIPTAAAQTTGVATESFPLYDWPGNGPPKNSCGFESGNGLLYANGAEIAAVPSWAGVTTLSVLLDADAPSVVYWVDGDDLSGLLTVDLSSATGSTFYAVFGFDGSVTANFGASAFAYTPPAGYEPGFGLVTGGATSVFPSGVACFTSGAPTVLLTSSETVYPPGASITSSGEPEVLEGPNRAVIAQGIACAVAGTPYAQLGYPETLEPDGPLVFAAGAPAVLPYSNKTAFPIGSALFQAGSPVIAYDPIVAGNTVVRPSGSKLVKPGTHALSSSVAVRAAGPSLLTGGVPAVGGIVRHSGASIVSAGAPSVGARMKPPGISALRVGAPSFSSGIIVQGLAATKVGAPRASGTAAIIAPSGSALLSAGAPSTHTAMRPWGKTHCRSGTPAISRGATC